MSYKTYDKHMSICTSYMNKHKPLNQTLADYIVFTVTKLASNTLYNTNTMFCNIVMCVLVDWRQSHYGSALTHPPSPHTDPSTQHSPHTPSTFHLCHILTGNAHYLHRVAHNYIVV